MQPVKDGQRPVFIDHRAFSNFENHIEVVGWHGCSELLQVILKFVGVQMGR